jgi:chemotaxis protein MotA
VLLQFPLPVVLAAVRRLAQVFFQPNHNPGGMVQELVRYANRARREGIVSLDAELENIKEPFLKKSLTLAVDGTEPQELRAMMELDLDNQTEYEDKIPQVFESAGGFSPTIGIIGAVLGLIQVMQHLDKIDEVGRGIAVAFVATIYGVGAANLFLLPAAGKLRIRIREEQVLREMTLEGVVSILEGMNPRMLETKLLGFLGESKSEPAQKAQAASAK